MAQTPITRTRQDIGDLVVRLPFVPEYSLDRILVTNVGTYVNGYPFRTSGVPVQAANITTFTEVLLVTRNPVTVPAGGLVLNFLAPRSLATLDANMLPTTDYLGAAINFAAFVTQLITLGFNCKVEGTQIGVPPK
jgi:hypothetical protein